MRVEEKNKSKKFNKTSKDMPKNKKPGFKPKDMPHKFKPGVLKPDNVPFNKKNGPMNPKKASFHPKKGPQKPKSSSFSSMKKQFKPWNQNFNLKKKFNSRKTLDQGQKYNTFLVHAKRFGRRGLYGNGAQIDREQHSYLITVLESLQRVDLNCFNLTTIANKFLKRISDEEILIASNQVGAKALVDTIAFAGPEQLEHLFKVFTDNLSTLYLSGFASRVLVRLIETAFLRAKGDKKINDDNDKIEPPAKKSKTTLDRIEYSITEQFSQKHRNKCSEFIECVSQFVLENLQSLVNSLGGSNILCQCALSLVGLYIPSSNKSEKVRGFCELDQLSKQSSEKSLILLFPRFQVPSEWVELMKQIVLKLEGLSEFSELPYQPLSCISLQYVSIALSHVDKKAVMDLYKKLLQESFIEADVAAILARVRDERTKLLDKEKSKKQKDVSTGDDEEKNNSNEEENSGVDEEQVSNEEEEENSEDDNKAQSDDDQANKVAKIHEKDLDNLPPVFAVGHSRKLLTLFMIVGGPEVLSEIYKDLLAERFMEVAKKEGPHFIIEGFLNHISDKELFKTVCNDLLEHMHELPQLLVGNFINAISGACVRLNVKQKEFMVALKKFLNLEDKSKESALFACAIQNKPYENKTSENIVAFKLLGSQIVQNILHFQNPNPMVNSILQMQPTQISSWTNSPAGFNVSTAFLKSKTIDSASREMYIDRFKGQVGVLARTQFGCDMVKEVFAAANIQQKLRIVRELIDGEKIQRNEFGQLLWNDFKINLYINDPEEWRTLWSDENETVSKLENSTETNKDETVSEKAELENEIELETTPKSKGKKTAATPKTGGKKKIVTLEPEDPEVATPKAKGNKTPTTPKSKKKNITPKAGSTENETTVTPRNVLKKTKATKRPAPS